GAYGADRAYPRAIVEDDPTVIQAIVHYFAPDVFCGRPKAPSEFTRPWAYPQKNNANQQNGWEPALTHPGFWLQGQDARVLMNRRPGDPIARDQFETAATPMESEAAAAATLPLGRHLGDPVDYGIYFVGRLTSGQVLPDFNLDADRGYAYHCWDWNRDPDPRKTHVPSISDPRTDVKYRFQEPCTVPEGFCEEPGAPPLYSPLFNLAIHYERDP